MKTLNVKFIFGSLMAIIVMAVFMTSCEQENLIDNEEVGVEYLLPLVQEEGQSVESRSCQHCDNCVLYSIHCKGLPYYPKNMTTISAKKSIVNRSTPCYDCAAIIDNGYTTSNGINTGHLAVVTNYYYSHSRGEYKLFLEEGGWSGGCNSRWVYESDAQVYGYYKWYNGFDPH